MVEVAAQPSPRPTIGELEHAIRLVRPRLYAHAGDAEVVSIDEFGKVTLRFHGACLTCPAKPVTLAAALIPVLEEVEGVTQVVAEGVHVDQAHIRRMQRIIFPGHNSGGPRPSGSA